jgi:hypothetical protein
VEKRGFTVVIGPKKFAIGVDFDNSVVEAMKFETGSGWWRRRM